MTSTPVDLSQLAFDREQPSPSKLGIKRHLLTRYLIPAALVVGFVAVVAWAAKDSLFPPLAVNVMPVLVSQESVRASGTPLFNAAGWIEPRPTAIRVPGLAAGVVEQLLVVEDQFVKAGEPVAVLIKDDAELTWQLGLADQELREAELDHAKAALTAAILRFEKPVHLKAELGEAEASLATIQTELANLPFELTRANSQLDFANSDYQRNLNARNSVSKREVHDAKTKAETMQSMVNELKLRDSSLRNELKAVTMRRDALQEQLNLLIEEVQARDQADARVSMADARLKQSNVAVAEAKLRLDRMTVKATVDGRVLQLVGQPGTRIGGMRDSMMDDIDGSTVITMYKPDKLQVKVDVRFEDLPNVTLGQPVRIDNPALGEPLTGSVLFISSKADIQKNTLEVKVAIDLPPPVFKPEMLVDVTFLSPESSHDGTDDEKRNQPWRIYVPRKLLTEHNGTEGIWIADRAKNVATHVGVQIGEQGLDETVEITSGLDVTSRLITNPLTGLKQGRKILIKEKG